MFEDIGPCLVSQKTRIVLFGDYGQEIISWKDVSRWSVESVIEEWAQSNMGATWMWEIILNDVRDNYDKFDNDRNSFLKV